MTTAQKNAKAKFKQAIAYRQKTGVSLKEAFAHIYGKKVGSVAKKTVKTKTAKKVKLTPDDKKDKSAFNAMARKYKNARVGALKLKPNEMRLGLLSNKIGLSIVKKASAKVKRLARNAQDAFYEGYYEGKPDKLAKKRAELKTKRVNKSKKPSEKDILNKIKTVKKSVNVLDNAQKKHMSKSLGSVVIEDIKKILEDIERAEKGLKNNEIYTTDIKMKKSLRNRFKKYISEKKTHLRELKKSL